MNKMRIIIFYILLWTLSSFCFCQNVILNENIDVIGLLSMKVNDANKILGKPSRIDRGPVTQPFCGMSRGRTETFVYNKHGLKIETMKKIGYEKRRDLRKWNKKRYYKNCSVWSLNFSSKSNLTLNSVSLKSINQLNIDKTLKTFAIKLENNKYKVKTEEESEYVLIFNFEINKLKELRIKRYYAT